MSNAYDGGPAFPIPGAVSHYDEGSFSDKAYAGMTLRDYFAAKAMQAIVQNPEMYEIDTIPGGEAIAANAYDIADAMLRARES